MGINKKKANHKIKSSDKTIRPLKKGESLKSLIILIFMLVACMSIFLVIIYFAEQHTLNAKDVNIEFKENKKFNEYMKEYTYRFVGESTHLYFQTGQVYLSNDVNKLSISNLKVKDIDDKKDNKSYAFRVFIKNKLIFGDSHNIGNADKNRLEQIKLGLVMNIPDDKTTDTSKLNALALTNKDTFKKDIKVEGVYCENQKCKVETFKLGYID